MVRAELMENIPNIAVFCHEQYDYLKKVIYQQIVPIILKCLNDTNAQVRKSSQAALLLVLGQGLISQEKFEEWICPQVIKLTDVENTEEYRGEAVSLMCRIGFVLGREIIETFFLHHFGSLCHDASFNVRKVCAANFGDLCVLVGREVTENYLLPKFYYLCEDGVWNIRKSCADVFMPVSSICSMEIRKSDLAPLFINLLCDDNRWVRVAAFQTLGPFISTFASSQEKLCSSDVKLENSNFNRNEKECFETAISVLNNAAQIQNSQILDESSDSPENSILTESLEDNMQNQFTVVPEIIEDSEPQHQDDDSNIVTDKECVEESSCSNPEVSSEDETDSNSVQKVKEKQSNSCVHSSQKLNGYSQDITNSIRELSLGNQFDKSVNITCNNMNLDAMQRRDSISESPLTITARDGHLHVHIDNEGAFNNFQYWRIPIPDLEVNIDIADGKATNIHIRASAKDDKMEYIGASEFNVSVTPSAPQEIEDKNAVEAVKTSSVHSETSKLFIQAACVNTVDTQTNDEKNKKTQVLNSSLNEAALTLLHGNILGMKKSRMNVFSSDMESIVHPLQQSYMYSEPLASEVNQLPQDQDIIPSELLQHYLNMTNSQARAMDPEITHHCAYNLPAVAFTLGKKYWPFLKDTYGALASDMQWKVRRTLASSLHELALILGTELTARDLLPVFISFLRDLDEVRIGILQHLSEFLIWLQPMERREFLPQIGQFLNLDNVKNWRFRLTLAEQLVPITNLYSPSDVKEYLIPVAFILVNDKVCDVRRAAVRAVAVMIRRLQQSPDHTLVQSVLAELEQNFLNGSKWLLRQIYALLCENIAQEGSLSKDQYVREIVPRLFTLTWDNVPNVRLAAARCLTETLLPLGYFPIIETVHSDLMFKVIHSLQSDVDRDVRYFACQPKFCQTSSTDQNVIEHEL